MTSKQRAYLKSLASTMDPLFQIGKGSVTPEVIEAISEAFNNRELIKIAVLKNCFDDPKAIAQALAERTHSTVVHVIGKKIVLDKENKDKKKVLNNVSFEVKRGQILGVAGVEGNGQSELAEVLAGTRKASAGKMFMFGNELHSNRPEVFIRSGIGYIPADRNGVGTVPNFLLFENWLLRKDNFPSKKGFIDRRRVVEESVGAIQEYDVRTTGPLERSANLSGGNLQKFILARELKKKPHMLVCSYPTRGLDVKASYFVRNQITKAKEKGTSTILFSGDMEELFSISDRIVVLNRGKVVGEKKPEETTHEEIILMMMGEKV